MDSYPFVAIHNHKCFQRTPFILYVFYVFPKFSSFNDLSN
jgi:hypothetical protein